MVLPSEDVHQTQRKTAPPSQRPRQRPMNFQLTFFASPCSRITSLFRNKLNKRNGSFDTRMRAISYESVLWSPGFFSRLTFAEGV